VAKVAGERRTRVQALLVPVDAARACTVLMVPRALSRLGLAIRGGPLHGQTTGTIEAPGYVWCGQRREVASLAENARALALAARLGVAQPADRIWLRGDVIVTGAAREGRLADVPHAVWEAAYGTRLLDDQATPAPLRVELQDELVAEHSLAVEPRLGVEH
jgi:hypothetical protein